MTYEEIIRAIDNAREQALADGCEYCAFMDKEEWEMPCSQCKRSCKDYWRRKEE